MEISVYSAENFDRGKWRYVIFSTVIVLIFVLSITSRNIVGAILLFFLLGGYFYYSVSNNQLIKTAIADEGLKIGNRLYGRNNISGYILEIDSKTQVIKNIVFIIKGHNSIHTVKDTKENIKKFVVLLNDHLPMLGEYEQTFLEKFARKLKL